MHTGIMTEYYLPQCGIMIKDCVASEKGFFFVLLNATDVNMDESVSQKVYSENISGLWEHVFCSLAFIMIQT